MMSEEPFSFEFKDATGVALQVGLKVGWGVGGRRTFGLVIGEIIEMRIDDKERNCYDHASRSYTKVHYKQPVVKVRALEQGRNGREFTPDPYGEFHFVCIANQDYVGTK